MQTIFILLLCLLSSLFLVSYGLLKLETLTEGENELGVV